MNIIVKPLGTLIFVSLLVILGVLAFRRGNAEKVVGTRPSATSLASSSSSANLLKPTGVAANWVTDVKDGAQIALKEDSDGVLEVQMKKSTTKNWVARFFQKSLPIPEGAKVTLHYQARSVPPQSIKIWAENGTTWNTIRENWGQSASYTPEWQDYTFTFVAQNSNNGTANAPVFAVGGAKGSFT